MDHTSSRLLRMSVGSLAFLLAASTSAFSQTCSISMPPVVFGNVDVLTGTAVDTTSTLTLTCSGGTGQGQRVCISIGAGSANDASSRQMTNGAARTRFDFYKDAARTQLWGSWETGYNNSGVSVDVPKNSTTSVTLYARFFGSQQTASPGSYSSSFNNNPHIRYANRPSPGQAPGQPCPAGANVATTSTSATVNVLTSCNVSATNVNFGSAGFLASNKDASGTLAIQCNPSLPYTVSLNGGTSGASDPTQRKMAFGADTVTYGLYRDAARSLPWGDNIGVNTASGTGNGVAQNMTVYGRIPPQTTPQPGGYSDLIIVTVGY
jgi:spore coat protein U-like protein